MRNERLARLLSQVTEGIICVDRNWIVTFANEEACHRSQHHSRRHRQRKNTLGDLSRTSRHRARALLSKASCGPARRPSIEYYSERIDGWLNVSVYPTDEGIALFYHDITDRKGAELLRDASVRQLRQVLETTTDAVASIDRDWNISFLNRRAKELLSSKGELLGKNSGRSFPSPHRTKKSS